MLIATNTWLGDDSSLAHVIDRIQWPVLYDGYHAGKAAGRRAERKLLIGRGEQIPSQGKLPETEIHAELQEEERQDRPRYDTRKIYPIDHGEAEHTESSVEWKIPFVSMIGLNFRNKLKTCSQHVDFTLDIIVSG